MQLHWLALVVAGGVLGGCGQTGPLYHAEEAGVTEEVELTDTIAEQADPNLLNEGVTEQTVDGQPVEVEQDGDQAIIERVPLGDEELENEPAASAP